MSDFDHEAMGAALDEARRAAGLTSPNPPVGAVITHNGKVIAQGYHRKAGGPHAEIEALDALGGKPPKGAQLYVTLEPCDHDGLTPPCTQAILKAGIKRVVIGAIDRNPKVAGRGVKRLRAAGVEVVVGARETECTQLYRPFFKFITTGRPFVTIKAAMTLDGQLATSSGDAKWITGPAARARGHRLRFECDAVLTGAGTVVSDNPQLTVRDYTPPLPKSQPLLRVVLSSRLRLPLDAAIFRPAEGAKTLVYTTDKASRATSTALAKRDIEVVTVAAAANSEAGRAIDGVDLPAVLDDLGRRGVVHALVEAGGMLNHAFFAGGFADRLALFVAPTALGGSDGVPLFAGPGATRLPLAHAGRFSSSEKIGDDVLLTVDFGE